MNQRPEAQCGRYGAQRSKVTEQMSPKHLVRPIKTKTETLFEARRLSRKKKENTETHTHTHAHTHTHTMYATHPHRVNTAWAHSVLSSAEATQTHVQTLQKAPFCTEGQEGVPQQLRCTAPHAELHRCSPGAVPSKDHQPASPRRVQRRRDKQQRPHMGRGRRRAERQNMHMGQRCPATRPGGGSRREGPPGPWGKRKGTGFVTPMQTNVHGDAHCLMAERWTIHKTTETALNNGWRLVAVWRRLAVGGWRLAVLRGCPEQGPLQKENKSSSGQPWRARPDRRGIRRRGAVRHPAPRPPRSPRSTRRPPGEH